MLCKASPNKSRSLAVLAFLALAGSPLIAYGVIGGLPSEQPSVAPDGRAAAAQYDRSILDDPSRPQAERERDSGSKPFEVYAFFGIEPGMTVVDLMPSAGYNTHILSKIVGSGGRVIGVPDRRGRLQPRVDSTNLTNVQVLSSFGELAADSADVMVTVRNLHDLENRGNTGPIYATFLRTLKPGGILGVVDARTTKPGFDGSTHRINENVIIENLTAAGFEFVEASDILANPDDDYDARGVRWDIDRFVLKFRKPER